MTTALDSFRDASLNPLNANTIPPGQIANVTGSTSPCGFIPDVYGNNAYFNNICAAQIVGGLPNTLFASARTHTVVTIPTSALPFSTFTTITSWAPSQANMGLPVTNTGVQVTNQTLNYLITLWAPCVVSGAPSGPYEITTQFIFNSPELGPTFLEFNGTNTFVVGETNPIILLNWQFPNFGADGIFEFHVAQSSGQSMNVSIGATIAVTSLFLL